MHPVLFKGFCGGDPEAAMREFAQLVDFTPREKHTLLFKYTGKAWSRTNWQLNKFMLDAREIFLEYHHTLEYEALYYNARYDFIKATRSNEEACAYLKDKLDRVEKGIHKGLYLVYISSSWCYHESYDSSTSIEYVFKAMEVGKHFGGSWGNTKVGHCYKTLGFKYYDQGLLQEAKESFLKSKALFETYSPISEGLSDSHAYLGKIAFKEGNTTKALEELEVSKSIMNRMNHELSLTHYVREQGELLIEAGQVTRGLDSVLKAQNFYVVKEVDNYSIRTYIYLLPIMLKNGMDSISVPWSDKQIDLQTVVNIITTGVKDKSIVEDQLNSYDALVKYYDQTAKKDSLVKYQEKLLELTLEVQQKAQAGQLKLAASKLENAAKEEQLAFTEEEKIATTQQLIAAVVILLLVSGIAFYYSRNNKNHRRLLRSEREMIEAERQQREIQKKLNREELLAKEKEQKMIQLNLQNEQQEKEKLALELERQRQKALTTKIELQKNTRLITEIQKELDSHKTSGAAFAKLKQAILVHGASSNPFDAIKEEVEKSGTQIIGNLKISHPELNKRERTLAAMIALEYSTNEIAHLLKVTEKTITQNKYRLKKKLNLNKNVELSTYLQEIAYQNS